MAELKENDVVEEAAPKKRATKTVKKETEKKTTTAKKAPAKKATAEKAPTKKVATEKAPTKKAADEKAPTEKKTPVKRTRKAAEPETTIAIQFAGDEITTKDIVEKVKAAYTQINSEDAIKTLEVYVKPEEGVAYYVVNGVVSDDYKVEL